MRVIRLHEDAFRDRDEISAYIGEDSPRASIRFLEAAQDVFDRAAEMPGSGALRDYGNPALPGLRVIPIPDFQKYGVYYITTTEAVEIIRVIHGSQDLDSIFAPAL